MYRISKGNYGESLGNHRKILGIYMKSLRIYRESLTTGKIGKDPTKGTKKGEIGERLHKKGEIGNHQKGRDGDQKMK